MGIEWGFGQGPTGSGVGSGTGEVITNPAVLVGASDTKKFEKLVEKMNAHLSLLRISFSIAKNSGVLRTAQ
jgi:hypothetical protein